MKTVISKMIISLWLLFSLSASAQAHLKPIENAELDQITGNAGISIAVKDVQIFQNIDRYIYAASDGGYLILNNLQSDVIRYNFNTPDPATGIFHMDVGVVAVASLDDWDLSTNPTEVQKGMFGVFSSDWDQEISYLSDGFIFSNGTNEYNLGELYVGQIRKPSWKLFLAPHENGHGIDFEYSFEMNIDRLAFAYQIDPADPVNNFQALIMDNLRIGQSFDFGSPGDDPSDPATWKSDIGQFRIGNMFGDLDNQEHARPGQIDAGVAQFEPGGDMLGSIRLALPMTGSIRFEKVEYGGVDFGPGAIDGINAYRMDMYFIP